MSREHPTAEQTDKALSALKEAREYLSKAMAKLYEARSRCPPLSEVWEHIPDAQSTIHIVERHIHKAEAYLHHVKKEKTERAKRS